MINYLPSSGTNSMKVIIMHHLGKKNQQEIYLMHENDKTILSSIENVTEHPDLEVLSYNYTMRFIGYDFIQTRWFISYRFQFAQ